MERAVRLRSDVTRAVRLAALGMAIAGQLLLTVRQVAKLAMEDAMRALLVALQQFQLRL